MEEMKTNRGRPKGTPKDDWHVSVDLDVATYFRLVNLDEFTGKVRVGAFSELCNRLLRTEMERQQKEITHENT